ncbi:glycosyltransferase [Tieghemostelium lacteum]|uniref:Alpha-1,3/1,6-mannosyltransferase ALG2 n=1 Tax=Tieghemostelium lacteum TaxID=361077 RepID=A0A152A2F4_TIELA|nr:glycosyltransferase [Tieghemostelium lacteum]|eukprot:KYR00399.1 glycosyltransferase [Tieghemostelium lacteum]
MNNGCNIAFLHPDLGIGGAERLIVDAAVSLKSAGHKVCIYTSRHDPKRSFKETHNGQLDIHVRGNVFPRSIGNRFMVICAMIRNILAALSIIAHQWKYAYSPEKRYQMVIIDQISASIPLFKLLTPSTKILFYCHFPDKLLSIRNSWIKSVYRLPIDYFEEFTTSFADQILVNSNFTRGIFKKSFKFIKKVPSVLYPPLNTDEFLKLSEKTPQYSALPKSLEGRVPETKKNIILSINRFERKKNLPLAIESFSILLQKLLDQDLVDEIAHCHLVIAGGYDPDLRENVEHLRELQDMVTQKQLSDKVSFVCSFNEQERSWLLNNCLCMVYTPSFEHFGITPLEGMFSLKPVVAVNSGGPIETVLNDSTGYLCEPLAPTFATALYQLVSDKQKTIQFGNNGRKWVEKNFSLKSFTVELNKIVLSTLGKIQFKKID